MSTSSRGINSLNIRDESALRIRSLHPDAVYDQSHKAWDLRTNDERELAIAYHRSRIDRARREGLFQDEHTQKGEIPGA